MKFIPERLEVAAGDTITWTNRDFLPHTVTAAASGIESGRLGQDASWKLAVREKGEIRYICRLHPAMRGLILVK
jgi:plastocyanin